MFSDYIIYVDESGDHGLVNIDPHYPVFVLSFCIFKKNDYAGTVSPNLQRLKFKYFGHDMVIFHSREIRKRKDDFKLLQQPKIRDDFYDDLNLFMKESPFTLICSVIKKEELLRRYRSPHNPYAIALAFCLERAFKFLMKYGQGERYTHVVVESRGKKEDIDLELEFRRICDGKNYLGHSLPFRIIMANKLINSSGLQLADLVSHPVGRHVIKPEQPHRAYEIVSSKFDVSSKGEVDGWGLKQFP